MLKFLNPFLGWSNNSACSRNSLNFMRNRNQCETAHLDICTFCAILAAVGEAEKVGQNAVNEHICMWLRRATKVIAVIATKTSKK